MTAPTWLDDEDDDLLPHGGPEHHTYRASNGDIRCAYCPLELGRPAGMPDYAGATMIAWSGGIFARISQWWYLVRLRRRYRKIFRDPALIVRRR